MNEESFPLKIDRSILCQDSSLNLISRPESMSYRSPRFIGIGTVSRLAVFTNLDARCCTGNGQVYDGRLVCHGFDAVCCCVVVEFECYIISVEICLVFAEIYVAHGVGGPQIRLILGFGVEDLGVVMTSCSEATIVC